jgi:hypothetical protein
MVVCTPGNSLLDVFQSQEQRHGVHRKLTATQNAVESEKAQRYIQQLDDARCAGRWQDVPELCRKVEKHAPHRKCARHSRIGGFEG